MLDVYTVFYRCEMDVKYIRAYKLMEELILINQMPDSLEKARIWRAWNTKAMEWGGDIKLSDSRSRLHLVQSVSHPVQQNHGALNQKA